jgi:hypothetical protein
MTWTRRLPACSTNAGDSVGGLLDDLDELEE